jgi:hypothetical protein
MEMDLTEKARPMSPRVPTVPGSHLGPSPYARAYMCTPLPTRVCITYPPPLYPLHVPLL